MTFVDRDFPAVVRDVLTNLTQGVSAEVHRIPVYDTATRPVRVPDVVLRRRPVRRVSLVTGYVAGATGDDQPVPVTFSLDDYELVAGTDDPRDLNTIRFLPFGRKPAPDTDVSVNYYPRNVEPAPLTDVNIGSVVRTLVEAVAKELAVAYAQLERAYESAFVDTAAGSSLDRVVALLGLRRFRAGRPVGTVRFSRRPGSPGTISIPPGTPVTDTADTLRYETVEVHTMLPAESTVEVRVRGATETTPTVPEGTLTVVQRAIAGIDAVTNERPTTTAAQDETDEELRDRARAALTASNKGTIGAIQNGLLQLPDVRAVSVQEFPNGVPGELKLSISLDQPRPSLPPAVLARIEELRPAGVRVLGELAASTRVQARVALVLAGSHLPPTEVERIRAEARRTIVDLVGKAGVGQKLRVGPLVGAILADDRIVDAQIRVGPKDGRPGAPGSDYQPEPSQIVELREDDVAFEPEVFDVPLPVGGPQVVVDVQAVVPAQPNTGVALPDVQGDMETRLADYVATLSAGTNVDAAAILNALRNDARYAIDPLGLDVVFGVDDQFVHVTHGGSAFTVQPGQSFSVTDVATTQAAPVPA